MVSPVLYDEIRVGRYFDTITLAFWNDGKEVHRTEQVLHHPFERLAITKIRGELPGEKYDAQ